MLQLILFSPDSIVPSGAALLSSISILPVFYVYSYPNETQPLVESAGRLTFPIGRRKDQRSGKDQGTVP